MAIRDNPPPGAPCWVDLMSSDTEASSAFYTDLFGWSAEEPNPEFGGYTNFTKDGDRVAGLMAQQPGLPDVPDVWSVYLCVADAQQTLDAAKARGAGVMVEAMPVGTLGTMAVVTDPGGAAIGMWRPGEHRGGLVGTGGAPCHFELQTRDYDAALKFYGEVFGMSLTEQGDTPGFRYSVYDVAEGENAGIMDSTGVVPDEVPNQWGVYFAVADVSAALAKILELGGSTVNGPDVTPYGVLAVATDSTGAMFRLRAEG